MDKIKQIILASMIFLLPMNSYVKAGEAEKIQVSSFIEGEAFSYLEMPWNISKEEAEKLLDETLNFNSEDTELNRVIYTATKKVTYGSEEERYFWNLQMMILVSVDWIQCGSNLLEIGRAHV